MKNHRQMAERLRDAIEDVGDYALFTHTALTSDLMAAQLVEKGVIFPPVRFADDLWQVIICGQDGNGLPADEHILATIHWAPRAVKELRVAYDKIQIAVQTPWGEHTWVEPNTQFACLSYADAVNYIKENFPDAYVLDASQTVRFAFYTPYKNKPELETTVCRFDELAKLTNGRTQVYGEDELGYVGIISADARKEDQPFLMAVLDDEGKIHDVLFGNLALCKVGIDENGFKTFTDIDDHFLEMR